MERHFDSIGPAGRVMMRRTASTQVCLDWWPGDEGWEQYRALLLSGPWIAAAYARSTGPGSRLATWLDVDPARTAFDGRLLVGDPVEAYARFAAGAPRFAEPHDTTLFPPVRPRGHYLEVRYLDAQPLDRVEQAIETIATIAYDADVRGRVLDRLEPLAPRLGDYWRAAAYGRLDSTGAGRMSAILFVTDPLDGLLADIDATVGLMTAAQAEGAGVLVCGPEDLAVIDGRLHARARRIRLAERTRGVDHRWLIASPWYVADEPVVVDVAETVEVAMLRIDPPVDARYLHATYLLDVAVAAGVRVVNSPAGVRALHEKLIALTLPHLSPATVVGACPHLVEDFVRRHGRAVVKPVDGFAGGDVWLVESGPSCRALVESATAGGRRAVIAQEYLPDVAEGNKRLFLLDGEIHGAVLRRPSAEDFRIGPPVAEATLDEHDREIADALAPILGAHGIAVAGVDVIAGRLIEVNVTCPGGMHKTDALLGTDLSGAIVRRLLDDSATESHRPPARPAYKELCL